MVTINSYNDERTITAVQAKCPNQHSFIRTSSCDYEDWREIEGYRLNCRQWNCEVCCKVLKNQLLDRIHYGLEGEQEFSFMTLTSSFREMAIKDAWNRFRNRLNYKYPTYRWVYVMELTPPSHIYEDWKGEKRVSVGGLRHFHILISFIDDIPSEETVSTYWRSSTKGRAWQTHFVRLNLLRSPAVS